MKYWLTFKTFRHFHTIARLVDEAGNEHEFKGKNEIDARKKAFDFIGTNRATVILKEPLYTGPGYRYRFPQNITIKYERGSRRL